MTKMKITKTISYKMILIQMMKKQTKYMILDLSGEKNANKILTVMMS